MTVRRSSIALGYLALILAGAVLLDMPWARASGDYGGFGDALFTSCSAVCLTGLSVVDVGAAYTRAGQVVLLALVEVGCLGLMTCGTFLLIAIGRRLSLAREFSLMNAYGVAEIRGLRSLICWVVGSTLAVEGLGALALYLHFHDAYQSVFFSVMGFCNAGFSLYPDSLARFQGSPLVVLTLAVETVLGGIGFLVVYNLCTFRFLRRSSGGKGRLSLHTRVVLRFTAYLLALALVAFLAVEWNEALAGCPPWERLYVSFYQAVTPRTCGFCVVPTESLQPLTRLVYGFLMVVGGAPGSAAAGVKVTTLAVLLYTLTAMWRGDRETVISQRAVPYDVVRESIVIVMAMLFFIALVVAALFATERGGPVSSEALFFEAVSAITTTGLSVGDTTRRLTAEGRAVIMVAMFLGRLGALSVVMMIGDREARHLVRYPSEELVVG